ncbi:FkbM family methyltransferase [Nodularia sp. UHCC 0506]|uniref:FkbM family methyltransferase n=1 Tax=Nodularia sp. UHCC 0506 TaxID=3110243 RepID=UPI002B20443F|nr:FkbM family methyltransferase [Nodularia sp. UHCC 0506]MEA5516905.1 FkbM family methyltransferase [Nodularia sp. UHCC 0506]
MAKIKTIQKLATNYLQQFNLLNATRFLFLDILTKLFDSNLIHSYSQTGEDRIIHAIINIYGKWEKADFSSQYYVEVGCNEPIQYSNTFDLYKRGWKGLCIDGNELLINKFKKLRPNDTSVCAVVSNSKDKITFTEFSDSGVSSVNQQHIEEWKKYSKIVSQKKITPISLNEVLDKYQAPKQFGLLSIDVEGHDFEVLSSINLDIYQPTLIIVEMTGFNISNVDSSNIFKYLKNYGYKIIAFAIGNAYFLRSNSI